MHLTSRFFPLLLLLLLAATALSGAAALAVHGEEQIDTGTEAGAQAEAADAPLVPHYGTGGTPETRSGNAARQAVRFVAVRDDPPFVFERRGLALGLYVDFVREMCDVMNLACVIDLIPRSELLTEELGERDVIIGAMPEEPGLADRYDFTQPILQNTGRVIVREDSALKRAWPEDLAQVKLGVIAAGPYDRFAREVLGLEPEAVFADLRAGLDALSAGAVDALFADGLRLNFFLATSGGTCCRILPGAYTEPGYFSEHVVMAVGEDNVALRQLMAAGIDNLTRNEERWGQIYFKYFPFGLY